MNKIFLILFSLVVTLHLQAQENKSNTSIKAAYLGSVIYPGFKLGIERPYRIKQINKKKKDVTKTIVRERALASNLGFYNLPTFHDNINAIAELQFRRQQPKGMFYEFAPGLGYSRTFLECTTYKVTDDGTVSIQKFAGYNYLMTSVAGGLGYDFAVKKIAPAKLYLKTSLFVLAPYNSFILHFAQ